MKGRIFPAQLALVAALLAAVVAGLAPDGPRAATSAKDAEFIPFVTDFPKPVEPFVPFVTDFPKPDRNERYR